MSVDTEGVDDRFAPDSTGHWGRYGGRFVPEALVAALDELTTAFEAARVDLVHC